MPDIKVKFTANLDESSPEFGTVTVTHDFENPMGDANTEHFIAIVDPLGMRIKEMSASPDGTGTTFAYQFHIAASGTPVYGEYQISGQINPNGTGQPVNYDETFHIAQDTTKHQPVLDYDCFSRALIGRDETKYDPALIPAVEWELDYPLIPDVAAKATETIGASEWQRGISHEGVQYQSKFRSSFSKSEVLSTQNPTPVVTVNTQDKTIREDTGDGTSWLTITLPTYKGDWLYVPYQSLNTRPSVQVKKPMTIIYNHSVTGKTEVETIIEEGTGGQEYTAPTALYVGDSKNNGTLSVRAKLPTNGNDVTVGGVPFVLYDKPSLEVSTHIDYHYEEILTADIVCDLDNSRINDCLEKAYADLYDKACGMGGCSSLSKQDQDTLCLLNILTNRRQYYLTTRNTRKATEYYHKLADLVNCDVAKPMVRPIEGSHLPPYPTVSTLEQDWTLFPLVNTQLFSRDDLSYRILTDRVEFRGKVTVQAALNSSTTVTVIPATFTWPIDIVLQPVEISYIPVAGRTNVADPDMFAAGIFGLNGGALAITTGGFPAPQVGTQLIISGTIYRKS